MKAKFLRDGEEITHPDLKSQRDVIELRRLLDTEQITPQEWRDRMFLTTRKGTIIDHPHAHRLVMMGMAEPADQECLNIVKRLRIDPEVTAEGQDRTRNAQLTGDPDLDRDEPLDDNDDAIDESNPADAPKAEPPIIIATQVTETPVPADQQSDQQKEATK